MFLCKNNYFLYLFMFCMFSNTTQGMQQQNPQVISHGEWFELKINQHHYKLIIYDLHNIFGIKAPIIQTIITILSQNPRPNPQVNLTIHRYESQVPNLLPTFIINDTHEILSKIDPEKKTEIDFSLLLRSQYPYLFAKIEVSPFPSQIEQTMQSNRTFVPTSSNPSSKRQKTQTSPEETIDPLSVYCNIND